MKKLILSIGLIFLTACSSSNSSAPGSNDTQSAPEKVKNYYAYSGAQYTNLIHQFSVSATTGDLTPLSTPSIAAQTLPMILAASYDKKVLMAINYSSNSVSSFLIDKASGQLTLAEHHNLEASSAPAWVVGHPSKSVFYTANSGTNKIDVLDVDAAGMVTVRNSVNAGSGVTCLVMNAGGSLLYSVDQGANQISIYAVDANGDLTFVSSASSGAGTQPNQAVLSPDGKNLYTANWGTQNVTAFAVSGTTLTSLGAPVSAGSGGVYTVTVSPDGSRLYAAKPYGNFYSILPIDTTGALGAAQDVAQTGSVNFTFWKDFAFVLGWTGNAAGLPIETRSYGAADGLGTSIASSTAGLQGVYQLLIVEVEQ